jgi:hypothetical protein
MSAAVPSELPFECARAHMLSAVENCIEIVQPTCIADVSDLVNALSSGHQHHAITCSWNHADPPPDEIVPLLTTYFLDPQIKVGNLRVWRNAANTIWLHCAPDGVWRFASALGSGITYAFSASTGGLHPPITSWCNKEGETIAPLIVTDALVWASICIQHASDDIRSLSIDVEPKPPKAPAASAPKRESIYQFLVGGVQPKAQKLSATAKVYPHPKLPKPPLAPPTWSQVKADKQKDALDETSEGLGR